MSEGDFSPFKFNEDDYNTAKGNEEWSKAAKEVIRFVSVWTMWLTLIFLVSFSSLAAISSFKGYGVVIFNLSIFSFTAGGIFLAFEKDLVENFLPDADESDVVKIGKRLIVGGGMLLFVYLISILSSYINLIPKSVRPESLTINGLIVAISNFQNLSAFKAPVTLLMIIYSVVVSTYFSTTISRSIFVLKGSEILEIKPTMFEEDKKFRKKIKKPFSKAKRKVSSLR